MLDDVQLHMLALMYCRKKYKLNHYNLVWCSAMQTCAELHWRC